jgi:rhodanese-related sulfurtransferase
MKTAHDLVAAAKTHVNEVPVSEADKAIQEADVLVDVRDTEEFTASHIEGALHVSRGMLEFKFSAQPQLQPRDLKIVLYCKSSGRAALAAQSLHEMGYLNVQSIAGGFDAWVAAGKPVVTPKTPPFE